MMKKTKLTKAGPGEGQAEVTRVSAENMAEFRKMMGPGAADQAVRQAIHTCWMMLPEASRTVDQLEQEFRRLVDRAFQNFREDQDRFGGRP